MAEASPRPPRIFISYRREDHPEVSAVLHARFGTRFGEANVFRDVPSLPAGEDFVRGIPKRVQACDVLVVLIGPKWVRLIREKAIEELDYVRAEIATALSEKKLIVPVCICGAKKPDAKNIHYQVRGILERNMVSLNDPLNNDLEVKLLLDAIEQSYAGREGLREEVERLEEFPPAAGLALGYFVNFISEVVPRITALTPDGGSYRHRIEVREREAETIVHAFGSEAGSRPGLKLHVVLPPTLDCLLPGRLRPLMARLHQALIRAEDSARPFVVDAWRHGGEYHLIDFPRTLGVLNTWLRRRLAKQPLDPETPEWKELAEQEMQRFEVILKWWVEDPGNGPGFGDRVRVVRFSGQEPELKWLLPFWNG